ncbi:hypothetical protein [Aquisphaera insulae]|uniref:hypothetical protein n=1 Tax=Aquisphaera insulae TaxID=2712864 RepID=UPI0013EA3F1B|nr:hypothetical protein [Aquisphaera insulae]
MSARPTAMASALAIVLPFLVPGLALSADPPAPPGPFGGTSLPVPPAQDRPWTPPATKLPRFLVDAAAALFDQGLADPRACEYRTIVVGVEDSAGPNPNDPGPFRGFGGPPVPAAPKAAAPVARHRGGAPVTTAGWVLPGEEGKPRFAIAWNGLIYPVAEVGGPADLEAEVRARIKEYAARPRERSGRILGMPPWTRRAERRDEEFGVTAASYHPLAPCILLRLGRADLVEELFAAATPWQPDGLEPDLTDYHISYLSLGTDWLRALFISGLNAHRRGDDRLALLRFREVDRASKAIRTRAEAMGFQPPQRGDWNAPKPGYFDFLDQLPMLLADQERRASETPRGPIPEPAAGADRGPRIAALVRDLDEVNAPQNAPQNGQPANETTLRLLSAEGDAAVGPLIRTLESDGRLTRSVIPSSGGMSSGQAMPVRHFARNLLIQILGSNTIEGVGSIWLQPTGSAADDLQAQARAFRAYWEKTRGLSPAERWYRTLAKDDATATQWGEAAGQIVAVEGPPVLRDQPPHRQGDSLRTGHEPTVSALMARRVDAMSRPEDAGRNLPTYDLDAANALCMHLRRWDPVAAVPVMAMLSARMAADMKPDPHGDTYRPARLAGSFARLIAERIKAGDERAIDEYALVARRLVPEMVQDWNLEILEPLWQHRERPAIAAAAEALFGREDSPWSATLRGGRHHLFELVSSPLLAQPSFRTLVDRLLADTTEIGTTRRKDETTITVEWPNASMGFSVTPFDPLLPPVGTTGKLRICDRAAAQLARIDGFPEFILGWPPAEKDAGIAACRALLKEYGGLLGPPAGSPPGFLPWGLTATLNFPELNRPATPDDVRRHRALFTLAGEFEEGVEVRAVPLPNRPIRGRWTQYEGAPISRITIKEGKPVTEKAFDQGGLIWQAEEVKLGEEWKRYYGFVGRHVIARVPAEEIEIP